MKIMIVILRIILVISEIQTLNSVNKTICCKNEKNSPNETLTDRNYPRKRTNSKEESHHEGIDKTVLAIKLKNYGIAQQIVGQFRIDCRVCL